MYIPGVSFVFIILSAISSVNYGFPHNTLSPNGSTNQETPLGTIFTSATPTREKHTESSALSNPSTSYQDSTTGHIDDDIDVEIENTLENEANNVVEVRRPVADILSNDEINQADAPYDENTPTAQDGFPWWSLMIILLATILVIVAIALPFVLYNRRLNQRRAVIKNNKRASEVVVDSWMAASQSSIPPASSSSTSSERGNDDAGVDDTNSNVISQSNWGMETADDGGSRDMILGTGEDES